MSEAVLEIKTWGNSLGLRIPSAVARAARLTVSQSVKLTVEDGRVIITPQGKKPPTLAARLERYAWDIWSGPESRSVTSRVTVDKVMDSLTDDKLAMLFRRSMPVSNDLTRVDRAP